MKFWSCIPKLLTTNLHHIFSLITFRNLSNSQVSYTNFKVSISKLYVIHRGWIIDLIYYHRKLICLYLHRLNYFIRKILRSTYCGQNQQHEPNWLKLNYWFCLIIDIDLVYFFCKTDLFEVRKSYCLSLLMAFFVDSRYYFFFLSSLWFSSSFPFFFLPFNFY